MTACSSLTQSVNEDICRSLAYATLEVAFLDSRNAMIDFCPGRESGGARVKRVFEKSQRDGR